MTRVVLSIAAACLAAGSAAAALPEVRSVALDNGVTLLLAPDSLAGSADVAVWYRAGSRHEPPGRSGLAYLFGRLMQAGTASAPAGDHRRTLEAEGATLGTLTNPDYSSFYQTLPGEAVDLALRLEADRMASLSITPSALETARAATLAEQRLRLAPSPLARGIQRLYATAYAGHPYARPVIGLPGELSSVTLEEARAFHRGRFAPSQAVVTVVGRFDAASALATARRAFGAVPARPAPAAPSATPAPQASERRGYEKEGGDAPLLLIGWRGPGSNDPDSPAMDAIAEIVRGGLASRLQLLRARRPDLAHLEGDYDRGRDGSLLFCFAALRAGGADTSDVEGALIAAVEAVGGEPVSEDELDRARRRIEAETLSALQTPRGRAQALGAARMLEGDPRAAERRLEAVRRLTTADVSRAAARVLRPASRTVVWVYPSRSAAQGGAEAPGGAR